MKNLVPSVLPLMLLGCMTQPVKTNTTASADTPQEQCIGSTELPDALKTQFKKVDDPQLLQQALGGPDKGKLCQGQVYQSVAAAQVIVYRAWNSTNPYSQFGNWWAFEQPTGKVADYRSDYEICYQWSPLDKMLSCTLQPGTKVVVGNGQSAYCSEYLTYPVSEKQQVFIVDAETVMSNCKNYDGVFRWQ
ncbi:MAG: hypothetical protein P8X74_03005 [Reinekea sp.]